MRQVNDTLTPDQVGARVLAAVAGHTMRAPRTQQQEEHRIGASELGHCRSYLKHMVIGTEYDFMEDPKWEAFIGTAVGDLTEAAYLAEHPGSMTQVDFEAVLPSGKTIPCHADIVDTQADILIDIKTKNGLAAIRRDKEPSRQHKWQVAVYRLGLIQAGLLTENSRVFLVYMDRSGSEYVPVTYEVVVDENVYQEIEDFINDALYAVVNDVEAPKDKEWDFCSRYCPFFSTCRGGDTLASGLIEDEGAALALKHRIEAMAVIKEQEALKKEADNTLRAYAEKGGYIVTDEGPYELSLTYVNPTHIKAHDKAGYDRMNVRKKKVTETGAKRNG